MADLEEIIDWIKNSEETLREELGAYDIEPKIARV